MKTLVNICLCLTMTLANIFPAYSQDWDWSIHIGSPGFDIVHGTSDPEGNFYIGGSWSYDTCFFKSHYLELKGIRGIYLAKYNAGGNELWVKQFDCCGYQSAGGLGNIITDANGNIYITGSFSGVLLFDTTHIYAQYEDMYIAKVDPTGKCLWVNHAGTTDNTAWGNGIAADSLGNVYVTGHNNGVAYFDSILVQPGIFLAKYDSNGSVIWARMEVPFDQGSGPEAHFSSLLINNNTLLAFGQQEESLMMIDTIEIYHLGKHGALLCCFNLSGNILWVREGVSSGIYPGMNITRDSMSNIMEIGAFSDSIKFGNTILTSTSENMDYFVAKYSKNGDLIWARTIRSNTNPYTCAICSDKSGNCYVTGRFSGTTAFGPDTLMAETDGDMFIARLNSSGDCLGANNFGFAEGFATGIDTQDNAFVTGGFYNNVTIGNDSYSSYGDRDIFLAKCDKITGIEEKHVKPSNQLIIYANPNDGKCNVTIPDEFKNEKRLMLSIFDNQGKLIQQAPVEMMAGKIRLNIQAEAAGVYNVILTNGRKNYTSKIIFN